MAVYPEAIKVFVYVTSAWLDISNKVVGDIELDWGFSDNSVSNRLASPGFLKFILNNTSGEFTPGASSSIVGWNRRIPCYIELTYQGQTYRRFYGRLDDIVVNSSVDIDNTVSITVTDWLDVAQKTPVTGIPVQTNYTTKQSIEKLLEGIPVAPINTNFSATVDTFSTMFDDIKSRSSIYSELNKIVTSEFGYVYLRKDQATGETLVLEGRNDRNSDDILTGILIEKALSSTIGIHTGDTLVFRTGDTPILHEYENGEYDNNMTDLAIRFGTNLSNRVTQVVYPKDLGTSLIVLSSLQKPIFIPAGTTVTGIKINFRDPVGGNAINGTNVQTRVATTDYKIYVNEDGTGTNLTANLVVTAVDGTEGTTYSLQNTSASNGWVTHLQARGYGIYPYDPVEVIAEDTASIDTYGYESLSISARYQQSTIVAESLTTIILNQNSEPRTMVNSVSFLANTNHSLMQSFMNNDIGDLIYLKNTQTGLDGYYYINNVKAKITQEGIILFSWGLREALTLSDVYWKLETVGFSELEETTFISPA